MKVGVSGHQNIQPKSAIPWVRKSLARELARLNSSAGISCLAAGADQIFAQEVLAMGIELHSVIPCRKYDQAFQDDSSASNYLILLELSTLVWNLDHALPSEKAFLEAGKKVVDICDSMIFVWDGGPAEGPGGTEDVVNYTRHCGKPFTHINPIDRKITFEPPNHLS